MRRFFAIALTLLCVVAAAQAQIESGFYPAASYDSDMIGNVNLNRGSLVISAPLLPLKQKPGFSLGSLYLTFDPPTYVRTTYCVSTSPDTEQCNHPWGPATDNFGGQSPNGQVTAQAAPYWDTEMTTDDDGVWNNGGFVVHSADGSSHPMVPVSGGYRSIDGTNYKLSSDGEVLTDSAGTTYAVQGTPAFMGIQYRPSTPVFYYGSTRYSDILATSIHGDSIYISAPSYDGQQTFTDSVGRTISVRVPTSDYTGCSGPLPTTSAYLATVTYPNHPTLQYKSCYATVHVNPGLTDDEYPYTAYEEDRSLMQSLVQSVDGTWTNVVAWTFEYNWTIPGYGNSGQLTKITNPLGGAVQYSYYSTPAGPLYDSTHFLVSSRVLHFGGSNPDQTTNYTYHVPANTTSISFDNATVSNGTSIVEHDFDILSGVENVTRVKDPQGNLLKTLTKTQLVTPNPYHMYHESGAFPLMANAQTVDEVTSYPDGTSCETTRSFGGSFGYSVSFYQSYYSGTDTQSGAANTGEETSESVYDCSTANLLRATTTTWKDQEDGNYFNANLFNLPSTVAVSGPSGEVARTQSSYDAGYGSPKGDLTSVTHSLYVSPAAYVTTSTGYDSHGMPTDQYDGRGNPTHTVYDATGVYPSEIDSPQTNGISHIYHVSADPITGAVLSTTDPNQVTSTAEYDLLGRPKKLISAYHTPIESWTQYSYPSMTAMTVSRDKATKGDAALSATTTFDGLGRVINQTNEAGMTVTNGYDSASNLASQTNPYPAGSGVPSGTTTTFQYDALGRVTYQYQPGGSDYLHWSYGSTVTDSYDEAGHHSQRTTDALGRLRQVREPDSNNSPSLVTDYTYDALGNLSSVNQHGANGEAARTRSFNYDGISRLLWSNNPETGILCYGHGDGTGGCTADGYDANGNLLYKTDARGVTTNYSYDALNRLVSKTYSDATPSVKYGYDGLDENGNPIGKQYTNGRLSAVFSGDFGTHYSYDAMGRVTERLAGLPGFYAYQIGALANYDLAGNQTFSNLTNGLHIDSTFDSAGRLSSATYTAPGANQPSPFLNVTSYGPFGPTKSTLGNGLTELRSYDNRGRQQSYNAVNSSATTSATTLYGVIDGFGNADVPSLGSTIPQNGFLWVGGWAATAQNCPVGAVEIDIDQEPIGYATLGGSRPDVQQLAYGNDGTHSYCGWYFSGSIGSAAPGSHLVNAYAIDGSGNRVSLGMSSGGPNTITVTSQAPPSGYFDGFTQSVVNGGDISASGWAIDSQHHAPVGAVKIFVDDQPIGYATVGNDRPDVVAAKNNDSSYLHSGWLFTGSIGTRSSGTHTLKAVVYDSAGQSSQLGGASGVFTVTDNQAGVAGSVDVAQDANTSLSSIPRNGTIKVGGWAGATQSSSCSTDINRVDVWLDSQKLGSAQQLHLSRSDVDAAYPGHNCGNTGYMFTGSLTGIAPGPHTISIRAYDAAGGSSRFGPGGFHSDEIQILATEITPAPVTSTLPSQYSWSLGYAPNGNVTYSSSSVNSQWAYIYDNLNRLYAAGSPNVALMWEYDSFGNRKSQSLLAGTGTSDYTTFSVLPNNRSDNACFDWAGNLKNYGACYGVYDRFQYDAEERLTSPDGGTTTYIYDGEGNRVAKKVNGQYTTYYFYDVAGHLQAESDQSIIIRRLELYAGNRHLATMNGGIFFHHQNWLGTEEATTDSSGKLCQQVTSQPFGDNQQIYGTCGSSPTFFTGKERDSESGLDYFGARYYGSSMGRFMSPDWSASPEAVPYAKLDDPQSLNLYAYARNNPVSLMDLDGHDDCSGQGSLDALCATYEEEAKNGLEAAEANKRRRLPTQGKPKCGAACRAESGQSNGNGLPETIGRTQKPPTQPKQPAPNTGTTCQAVPFKVTGIAPGQAPGTTAISQTPRAGIPDGGVAIKPGNFGVGGINGNNRSVFLGMTFTVDWSTAGPLGVPSGIPTQGPFFPVDNIGPASVRNSPGNAFDVYNYPSFKQAWASTRTVMVTTYIPSNTAGVKCPQ